tara:strand:- start:31402 stop:31530 length:129 start_codon:yes stop_codon:yes gene_type:complete
MPRPVRLAQFPVYSPPRRQQPNPVFNGFDKYDPIKGKTGSFF